LRNTSKSGKNSGVPLVYANLHDLEKWTSGAEKAVAHFKSFAIAAHGLHVIAYSCVTDTARHYYAPPDSGAISIDFFRNDRRKINHSSNILVDKKEPVSTWSIGGLYVSVCTSGCQMESTNYVYMNIR